MAAIASPECPSCRELLAHLDRVHHRLEVLEKDTTVKMRRTDDKMTRTKEDCERLLTKIVADGYINFHDLSTEAKGIDLLADVVE